MKNQILIYSFLLLLSSTLICFGQEEIVDVPSQGIDSIKNNRIKIYPGFGLSLVRNEFAPVFYINVGVNHKDRYEVNVNTASIFFFERDIDKNYAIYRNTFLNAEFLLNFSPLSKSIKNWNGLGAGYLIESKGQYFRDATFLVYYRRKFRFFSVMPGIIMADDFKDVFPYISIRL